MDRTSHRISFLTIALLLTVSVVIPGTADHRDRTHGGWLRNGSRLGTGNTYYVSTSGNDNNPGTMSQPWRTIQHAANSVAAGDTVEVFAGIYNEHINVPVSGNSVAGPITFQSYPGQTATVDGTGLDIPNGQYGLFNISNQSYVTIQGFEVRNYTTSKASQVPIGIYLNGAGAHLQILNNHIHDISTTAKGCAANAFGMTVYGTQAPASINNLTISGNEIDHTVTGCSETLSVDGNVQYFVITQNLVHDDNNIAVGAIGFEGVAPRKAMCGSDPCDRARDGYIGENAIYNITSYGNPAYGKQYAADGIYVDGGTRIIIERNLIHNVDLGIELASEHHLRTSDHVIARSNLIYFGNSAGISIGGYAAGKGGTDSCYIVNNSLLFNDSKNTGSGEFQVQFHATNNVFENNIAYATTQGLMVNNFTKSEPNPVLTDYNVWYSTVGESVATFVWYHKHYKGFAAYQQASGQDAHSFFADPRYLDLNEPNLQVQPTSPAVNAGHNLGERIVGTEDFAGNPRVQRSNIDIGAYEQ